MELSESPRAHTMRKVEIVQGFGHPDGRVVTRNNRA